MKARRKGELLLAGAALSFGTTAHADVITEWNAVTLACVQGPPAPPQRPGPGGLLDIALVHAAMHDAVQAIEGEFEAYAYQSGAHCRGGSPEAAAAAAAHAVLVGLYGAGAPCLSGIADPAQTYAGDAGLQVGAEAAAALLPERRPTLVLPTDPFLGGDAPGEWRPTPGVTQGAATFLAVTQPFALTDPAQFRPKPPPPLERRRYAREYDEVKALGALHGSTRSAEQTELAHFWTANFFSQWNEALRAIADDYLTNVADTARLFALVSFAAADSQISVYDAKYHYNLWRPLTAIQEGDRDDNPLTVGDPAWEPFIATPPYPDYTSGANCLVGAITKVLELFFGGDELAFAVWTTSPNATVNPRTYERLSDVMSEIVEVRILQGIHFRAAEEVGRRQGQRIGRWTFDTVLRPRQPSHRAGGTAP